MVSLGGVLHHTVRQKRNHIPFMHNFFKRSIVWQNRVVLFVKKWIFINAAWLIFELYTNLRTLTAKCFTLHYAITHGAQDSARALKTEQWSQLNFF